MYVTGRDGRPRDDRARIYLQSLIMRALAGQEYDVGVLHSRPSNQLIGGKMAIFATSGHNRTDTVHRERALRSLTACAQRTDTPTTRNKSIDTHQLFSCAACWLRGQGSLPARPPSRPPETRLATRRSGTYLCCSYCVAAIALQLLRCGYCVAERRSALLEQRHTTQHVACGCCCESRCIAE